MNKYDLKNFLHEQLKDYPTTFKEGSYDNAKDEYLCTDEYTQNIYDFDKYVLNNFRKGNYIPASPDVIYIGKKKFYFVEFKNQFPSEIDSAQMKRKFECGTNILKDSLLLEFQPRDVEYIFCVVYKKPQARFFNPSAIEENIVRFGLTEKNIELGDFYSEIITKDIDFYKEEFEELQC